jgi:hypothetical protein
MSEPQLDGTAERDWRRWTTCEEVRLNRKPPAMRFTGSRRWFASPNIIDLMDYRSPEEKERILNWHRRWPPMWW